MSPTSKEPVPIVLAEDDPEDQAFAIEALEASRLANPMHVVNDGVELLDYLRTTERRPGLVLLDIKMPRLDGLEALAAIREDPELRTLPVVMLTTSNADMDIARSYDLGVNSYIRKPVTFEGLVAAIRDLGRYWFELVELPRPR